MKKSTVTKKAFILAFFLNVFTVCFAQNPADFITEWKTDNVGVSNNTSIQIPAVGSYTVSWVNKADAGISGTQSFTGITTATYPTIDFGTIGTYEVTISDVSSDFAFAFGPGATPDNRDRKRLLLVKQWGSSITWQSTYIFAACSNLEVTATDLPKLSGDISYMFSYCNILQGNSSFNSWDMSNVTNTRNMFQFTNEFNQPIGNWDMSNVTSTFEMFKSAKKFNQPVGNWDLSKATNINSTFTGASAFNQSLGGWKLNPALSNTTISALLYQTATDCLNWDATLIGWANNPDLPTGVTYGGQGLVRSSPAGVEAHSELTKPVAEGGKGWTINSTSYNASCHLTLPVTFAGLKASFSDGELYINWSTVSEINNSHFIIKVSADGKNWKEVATVDSKAADGNSNEPLDYEYSINYNTLQLAGVPAVITLILAFLLFSRRKKLLITMSLLLTGMVFTNCNKSDLALNETDSEYLYIKVTQVDKDGKNTSDSNTVAVKRQ